MGVKGMVFLKYRGMKLCLEVKLNMKVEIRP